MDWSTKLDIQKNYDKYVEKVYSSTFVYLPVNANSKSVYITNCFVNSNHAIPYLVHKIYRDNGSFKALVSAIEITAIDRSYDDSLVVDYYNDKTVNCSLRTAEELKQKLLIPSDKIITIGICSNKWQVFLRDFNITKRVPTKYIQSENRVLAGYYINIGDFDNPFNIEIHGHNIIDLSTVVHHKFIKES